MRDHEAAMCAYAQLACLSHEKRQGLSRDRFLVLTALEACRAGWPDVAEWCRQRIAAFEPHHRLAAFATVADALRDPELATMAAKWERFCTFERAEHLLRGLRLPVAGDAPELSRGAWSLGQLSQRIAPAVVSPPG